MLASSWNCNIKIRTFEFITYRLHIHAPKLYYHKHRCHLPFYHSIFDILNTFHKLLIFWVIIFLILHDIFVVNFLIIHRINLYEERRFSVKHTRASAFYWTCLVYLVLEFKAKPVRNLSYLIPVLIQYITYSFNDYTSTTN